ncbi:MAG: ATP/GTP-binding protein, partial [Candidatus Nanopelagicales bacterium]
DVYDYILTWFATAPPGTPVSPVQLAQRAVDSMTLRGAEIQMAPHSGAMGLVGLPMWLWTTVGPTTWGPNSATATVPGLSVTAVAKATKIVWDMGDGTRLTCAGPGTPYSAAASTTVSPTCGHVYQRSSASRPGHLYAITATTTWVITWAGGGESGVLTRTRTSAATARVGELQVLIS